MAKSVDILQQGQSLQQQGRLAEAVSLYCDVLALEPDNGDALHLLGLALGVSGDAERAARLIGESVRLEPLNAAKQANLARSLQALGRHEEALACYDRALELGPGLSLAHRGRGASLMALGRHEEAVESFRHSVRLTPYDDQAHYSLGVALERTGREPEARKRFRQALSLNPDNAEAHQNLAHLESAAGRYADALASLDRALALQPQNAALHTNRGAYLNALGRFPEALESFDRALTLQPRDALAHHNRGLSLMRLQRIEEACASFQRALEQAPDLAAARRWHGKACLELSRPADALASLDPAPTDFEGCVLRAMAFAMLERHEESAASFGQATVLDPSSAEAFNNRGVVLLRGCRPAEALSDLAQAIKLRPDYVDAHINTSTAHRALGQHREALDVLDRALAIRPDDPKVTWRKALLKLARGELREGWPLLESRLQLEPVRSLRRPFSQPRWDGREPIAGKTLLVHAEHDLADTLQLSRYIRVLESFGPEVIFEVQPVLRRLLTSLGMQGTLLSRGEPLPQTDFHIPLPSLPGALGTELHTIPAVVPYLNVDAEAVQIARERLAHLPGLKVVINGCSPAQRPATLQGTSFPLHAATVLAELPGVSLVSLRAGAGSVHPVPFAATPAQPPDPLHAGDEEVARQTAALLTGLDLLITTDSALAHLAGALGSRVWVVLPSVADWRWLTDREDSPWYPSMRLFRQRRPGDWSEVLQRVAAELGALRC
jgi:tetratricopeptide (TPR) repeat protein